MTDYQGYTFQHDEYICTDRIKKMFSYRKLLTVGSFNMRVVNANKMPMEMLDRVNWLDTDLNSLWPSFGCVGDPDTFYY